MPADLPENLTNTCARCDAGLPATAPHGLCPHCLLSAAASASRVSGWNDSTSGGEPPEPEELQRLLPGFEIERLIRRGGMGAVYKARQPDLNRTVAIKVLPDGGGDPQFAARFQREAKALASLDHPNIVTLHEFGESGELYYFVMEFVGGPSLAELMKPGSVPVRQALRLVIQICDALDYAHSHGVVHRDIKPANVLVDSEGKVKITDFGLVKLLEPDAEEMFLTRLDQAVGTPLYMAPEQRDHPLEVDHRADIYSLGVVFYELLTGGLPIGHYPLPSQKVAVDVRLDGVVLRALEVEPHRRYQHAREVREDVEATSLETNAPPPPAVATRRRWRGPAIAMLAVAALVTGLHLQQTAHEGTVASSQPPPGTGEAFALSGPGGQLIAIGSNIFGEIEAVPELDDVVDVTAGGAGGGHNMALRQDGTVVAWGRNGHGQSEVPPALHRVVDIAQGYAHNLALTDTGKVVCWGRNDHGQSDAPRGLGKVTAIAAFGDHSMALTEAGRIVVWGKNPDGQFHPPQIDGRVTAIAAGGEHMVALKADGEIVMWGNASRGQTMAPEPISDARAIAAGEYHVAVLRERRGVHGWGGWAGKALEVPTPGSYSQLAAGGNSTIAVLENGRVVGWGPLAEFLPAGLDGVTVAACGRHHALLVTTSSPALRTPGRLRTAQPLATFGSESGAVLAMAISPDNTRLAIAADKELQVYDLSSYQPTGPQLEHDDSLWDVCFSSDSRTIACATNSGEVMICDGRAPMAWSDRLPVDNANGSPASLSFTKDDSQLAIGTSTGDILVYSWPLDETRPARIRNAHAAPIVDLASPPDGDLLYSASWDRSVRIWDLRQLGPAGIMAVPTALDRVESLALSGDGSTIAAGCWDGEAAIWSLGSRELRRKMTTHLGGHWRDQLRRYAVDDGSSVQVLLTPDAKYAITAGCDNEVRFWSVASGRMLGSLPGQSRPARAIALTADGKLLITTGHGNRLRAWDLEQFLP